MFRLAIVADPHVANVQMPYAGKVLGIPTLRTLADTVESTRVFNEGFMAFRATLDAIAERGLRHVVIVGDMTDDGQISAWRAFTAITDEYSARHGLRFYTTPGNHDLFGMTGRHNGKRILREDGSHVLLTSDPAQDGADAVVTRQMFCPGYPEALRLGCSLGYFPRTGDLHWETPFGAGTEVEGRTYTSRSVDGSIALPMVDASYLVEPEQGLWLLSLDANVYLPERADDGSVRVIDQSDAGWNAALAHKPHLMAWAADVARRAAGLGKTLVCFSHYPVVDPLAGNHRDEVALLGNTSFARRLPAPEVSQAFAEAGIHAHFSGHWHINNTAQSAAAGGITNIAVPAAVAFPPAFKVIAADANRLEVETVPLSSVPEHDLAFELYGREIARTGADYGQITSSRDQGQFLDRHLEQMVIHRYLPREWPQDLAGLVPRITVADLLALAAIPKPLEAAEWTETPEPVDRGPTMLQLITDWYRLRKGSQLALEYIPAARLEAYRRLARAFAAGSWPADCLQARLQTFMRMFDRYDSVAPSVNFSLELASGTLQEEAVTGPGLTDLRQTGSG